MFTIYCLNDLYWFVFVLSDPNIMTPNWCESACINDIKGTWYWYKILLNVLYQFLFWQKNKCRFFWDNSNNFRSAIKSTDITFFNLHQIIFILFVSIIFNCIHPNMVSIHFSVENDISQFISFLWNFEVRFWFRSFNIKIIAKIRESVRNKYAWPAM